VNRTPVPDQFRATSSKPPVVPDGRYAMSMDGVVKFYKVNTPTQGKWRDFTFVEAQASDEFYPVKGALKSIVLGLIAIDPQAATELYGKALGVCGICGRTLTNEESRKRGIGPICAQERGW
jgi:Family of unknown function (DUF6011)